MAGEKPNGSGTDGTSAAAGASPAQPHDPEAAQSLAKAVQAARREAKGPPPVHLWNPPHCGDLDIRIRRDGSWWYLGTPIGRVELVRLFASVLKREDGRHFLVTPVEKIGIRVDDAPFVAVDFRVEGDGADRAIVFVTNVGDETVAGPENPIRVVRDPATGEPAPYVHVRRGLEALIDRKSFYRLVDVAEHSEVEGVSWFGLRSRGRFFPVVPSAELPD
ncbi:MAG: DUF1285 domain-containing protein [Paracoccaceae bacterium]